jgi:hypothetical protein
MKEFNIGTIEEFPIAILDTLGTVTTLDSVALTYSIYPEEGSSPIVDNVSCANNGMIALPLLDLTDYDPGKYKLYLTMSLNGETPILGPVMFMANSL